MSDAKLRELERRWKETGSVEDEAAYLLERVRVGDLTRERLELAAYCGHEGARRAMSNPASMETVDDWIAGLASFGMEVCARAALAALEACSRSFPDNPTVRRAKVAVRTWLACPCDEHTREILAGDDIVAAVFADATGREVEAAVERCAVHTAFATSDRYFGSEEGSPYRKSPAQYMWALRRAFETHDSSHIRAFVDTRLVDWALVDVDRTGTHV